MVTVLTCVVSDLTVIECFANMMWNTSELTLVKIQTFGMSDLLFQEVGAFLGMQGRDFLKIMAERLCILELYFTVENGDLEKEAATSRVCRLQWLP